MPDSSAAFARVPVAAKLFAAFAFALAIIALVTFWPPESPPVIVWLVVWVATCLATATAILANHRVAPVLVWTLLILGAISAAIELARGALGVSGVLIDIVLFVPLVWFAIWYQRRRR